MKYSLVTIGIIGTILLALWSNNIIRYNAGYSECRVFSPAQDITAYELAMIYKKSGNKSLAGMGKIYFTLPAWRHLEPAIQRHFFECAQ